MIVSNLQVARRILASRALRSGNGLVEEVVEAVLVQKFEDCAVVLLIVLLRVAGQDEKGDLWQG